jgi:hypothetical protein
MSKLNNLDQMLAIAIKHFWATRKKQARAQGKSTGIKDQGARSAVTGGAKMDGFIALVKEILMEAGLSQADIFSKQRIELPGYFRAEKQWDLIIVSDGILLAGIEFKSQVGPSFGNNYNNRTEESLGNATDFWAAYREGAFRPSQRPWLGYLMLLEESPGSTRPISVKEPHYKVFDEFRGTSYSKRYEILLTKLVRERLYDGACLLLSNPIDGPRGVYKQPSVELDFQTFPSSLLARAIAFLKTK